MPLVKHLSPGQNVSMIRDLADRVGDLEARRQAEGVSLGYQQTLKKTALVGGSGVALVLSNYGGVFVDAAVTSRLLVAVAADNNFHEFFALGITGLTAGWHTFTVDPTAGAPTGAGMLAVWPI